MRCDVAEARVLEKWEALSACTSMALLYVFVLYSPTVVLRLPPPLSFKQFMIRRFYCAAFSSPFSFIIATIILRIRWNPQVLFQFYGGRSDHLWEAVVYPFFLTAMIYAGSFAQKIVCFVEWLEDYGNTGGGLIDSVKVISSDFIQCLCSSMSNILAWRNYIVAPVTEELVFRAFMIPLLLCAGIEENTVIFLCPVFFSLAHLNHLYEFWSRKNCTLIRAFKFIGLQLCYTIVFGWFASFLFIRTGHVVSPIVAHIFCNVMGLPQFFSQRHGVVTMVGFLGGVMGMLLSLFPLTSPHLYSIVVSTNSEHVA